MIENKKTKILFLPSDNAGVGHIRSIWIAQEINEKFSNDFYVEINLTPDFNDIEYFKKFDIIHFHRQLGPYEKMDEFFKTLKDAGVILIMDLDDYWAPPQTHPLYGIAIKEKLAEKITKTLRKSDYVTTTTDIFAKHIMPYNKNVLVMPNGVDVSQKMWKDENTKLNDRVRISWIGGSSHFHDLMLLKPSMKLLHNDASLKDKYQMIMCGYDVRGTITTINEDGSQHTRKILPQETIWNRFEEIFTDNYNPNIVSAEYQKWLKKCKNEPYPNENILNEAYVRRWTLPLIHYGKHYNYCDVNLAPLTDNTFNEVKCIVGDSLISTVNGIFNIKNIVENKIKSSIEINGIQHKIVNYFEYKNVPTIKIKTYNGYEIEGTPHHRFLINDKWIMLQDLKENDIIQLTSPIFLQKKYQEMSYPMLLTKTITADKILNSDESMIPKIKVNETWGRFIGYMLGDGHYGGASLIKVACDKRHTDVVEDVVSIMKSMGLNPKICEKKPDKRCQNSLQKEGFGVEVVCTCVTFLKIAKKYNLCGSHGKTFRVPDLIFQSPKSVIKEFIRGLFEADGTVDNTGCSLCSKDLKLIQQIQYLLLGFGITSHISHSYNKIYRKYYYRLNLNRDASDIFFKEINFISHTKRSKLKLITEKNHSNAFKKQIFEDKIVSIEQFHNDVYDMEINDVHSYNANGIINHNSELKVIESGMKKKVLIAQDYSIYKEILTHGETGLLISKAANEKGWYVQIKKLIEDKELRERLATNLHEFIKDKYSLTNLTQERINIYLDMIEKKKLTTREELLELVKK